MQFVIDENIPKEVTGWLEKNNHSVCFVPKGSSDEEVAAIAREKGFIILTLDRHFANTLRFPPKQFPGIIRIKIHPSYIEDIVLSLTELFVKFSRQEDFNRRLFILEKLGFFQLKK